MSEVRKGRGGPRPNSGRPAGSVKVVTISLDALSAVGLEVERGVSDGEWFVNQTIGPFKSPEKAVVEGVKWIYGLYREYAEEVGNK